MSPESYLFFSGNAIVFIKKKVATIEGNWLRKKLSIRMNIMCQDLETEEIANVTSLLNLNICFFSALDKEQ